MLLQPLTTSKSISGVMVRGWQDDNSLSNYHSSVREQVSEVLLNDGAITHDLRTSGEVSRTRWLLAPCFRS